VVWAGMRASSWFLDFLDHPVGEGFGRARSTHRNQGVSQGSRGARRRRAMTRPRTRGVGSGSRVGHRRCDRVPARRERQHRRSLGVRRICRLVGRPVDGASEGSPPLGTRRTLTASPNSVTPVVHTSDVPQPPGRLQKEPQDPTAAEPYLAMYRAYPRGVWAVRRSISSEI